MGITINLTLLVQMAHFLCAYIIITRLFLRPGYQAVVEDNQRFNHIRSRVVAHQELIAHKQAHKRTRWRLFQDYFHKQKPPLTQTYTAVAIQPFFKHESLTATERDALTKQIVSELDQKVRS